MKSMNESSNNNNNPDDRNNNHMPLKSDGSLCIMEALGRSQSHVMVSSSSPKLEDFLGGATMGTHDEYGSHERDAATVLSLDNIYYNNQQNAYPHQQRQSLASGSLNTVTMKEVKIKVKRGE